MSGISQKNKKYPKNGYFDKRIKKFHKNIIDGLNQLSTSTLIKKTDFENFIDTCTRNFLMMVKIPE